MKLLKISLALFCGLFIIQNASANENNYYYVLLKYQKTPSPYEMNIPISEGGYFALPNQEKTKIDMLQNLWRNYEIKRVSNFNQDVAEKVQTQTLNWTVKYANKIAPFLLVEYSPKNYRSIPQGDSM